MRISDWSSDVCSSDLPASALATAEPGVEPPPTSLGPSAALAAALDPVWSDTPGGCISVLDGDRVLYEANDEATVVTASLTKLLTAAAAVNGLGALARLRTEVRVAATPADGGVDGDRWPVGGGDHVTGPAHWAGKMDSACTPYTSLAQRPD